MTLVNHTPFAVESLPFQGPDGTCFLTVIVKATYVFSKQGPAMLAKEQQPILYGDIPFDPENGGSIRLEADVAPFKPRADIVLVGHAYAPQDRRVAAIDVSLRVGRLQKVLRVFGDRVWQANALTGDRASSPLPFDKMPLVYERAFGGIDLNIGGFLPSNPLGRGYFAKPVRKFVNNAPLPNIEDPANLIRTPEDRPVPQGFGFYGRAWKPRMNFVGTWDEAHRKRRSQGPPPDFKFDFYNAAHPDLQVEGYLAGGETVELINLSPAGPVNFQLPAPTITCRVDKAYDTLIAYVRTLPPEQKTGKMPDRTEPVSEQVRMNLDTLCLLPDENRLFVLWRGRSTVYDLTALEAETVTVDWRESG